MSDDRLTLPQAPAIYRPRAQHGSTWMAVIVRATRDAHDVLPLLREEVKALGASVTLVEFREFSHYLSRALAQRRLFMTLLSGFAGLTLVLALIGIACGLAASLAVRRAISQQLFAVDASDPLTLGVVSGLVLGTALLASYLPARRAANVQPVIALRTE